MTDIQRIEFLERKRFTYLFYDSKTHMWNIKKDSKGDVFCCKSTLRDVIDSVVDKFDKASFSKIFKLAKVCDERDDFKEFALRAIQKHKITHVYFDYLINQWVLGIYDTGLPIKSDNTLMKAINKL